MLKNKKINNSIFKNLFIFEMANNHSGDLNLAKKIVDQCYLIKEKYALNAAVKLQYRNLKNFIHPDFVNNKEVKHIKRFVETELSENDFNSLVEYIKKKKLIPISTPFDETSVDLCVIQNLPIIKVASCSMSDWPLLEKICLSKKLVIISTGGHSLENIDKVYNFFLHRNIDFALMHCVSIYPTPKKQLNLSLIRKYKNRYPDTIIGYSGHENPDDCEIIKMAISSGAEILERHVGIDNSKYPLNSYSLNQKQLDKWVFSAKEAKKILGFNNNKILTKEELNSVKELSRGVYCKKDIKKNELISRDKVYFAMPLQKNQLNSGEYNNSLKSSKNYKKSEPIIDFPRKPTFFKTRKLIHIFKAMFNEANIPLGNNYEIELSHHYNIEKFEKIGALLITIINRDYCKKIIAQLPGQSHPSHYHEKKEETFQILHGSMLVKRNDETFELKKGDTLLIQRRDVHSFKTKSGVIFEEISTKHIKGDSYYIDKKIQRADPILRKTVLEDW